MKGSEPESTTDEFEDDGHDVYIPPTSCTYLSGESEIRQLGSPGITSEPYPLPMSFREYRPMLDMLVKL